MKLLVEECFRHAKAIRGWGKGARALGALLGPQPGVVVADSAVEVLDEVRLLLRSHRVWDRFPATPPAPADQP